MTLVYNPNYDMLGILNHETGLVQIDAISQTIFMVYLDYTWTIVGEL